MATGIDLGIAGRVALVCGSSAGLGRGCARALASAGALVVLNGRSEDRLLEAQSAIERESGTKLRYVVGDVTTPEGRHAAIAACPNPDILVNNAAGPTPGDFRNFDEASWHEAVSISMIAPIMLMRAVIDGMIERRWGRIINITSSAVKAPLPLLGLSNGARSGLTGFVAGLAREVAPHGVTINNLLPGRFATDRLQNYIRKVAEHDGIGVQAAAEKMVRANPMGRFGAPDEFGAFCAFLASQQAAYMTGQNILLDGGEYPGL
jgi:3-oxoacyl-[acyl-carrier protein] reductase